VGSRKPLSPNKCGQKKTGGQRGKREAPSLASIVFNGWRVVFEVLTGGAPEKGDFHKEGGEARDEQAVRR